MKLSILVPKSIDSNVVDFCKSISSVEPRLLELSPFEGARELQCYFNVRTAADLGRGTPVFGWTVWLLPNIWLEAHHHCVLRNNDGDLIDGTPQSDGEREVLFLPDPSQPFDFARPRRVLKRRFCLSQISEVQVWINALELLEKFEWRHSRFLGEEVQTKVSGEHDVRRYDRLKSAVGLAEHKALEEIRKQ